MPNFSAIFIKAETETETAEKESLAFSFCLRLLRVYTRGFHVLEENSFDFSCDSLRQLLIERPFPSAKEEKDEKQAFQPDYSAPKKKKKERKETR